MTATEMRKVAKWFRRLVREDWVASSRDVALMNKTADYLDARADAMLAAQKEPKA
jgi:hypothetical protein